jgi:3D (Asp-Asp-Asp) domain-containing protein
LKKQILLVSVLVLAILAFSRSVKLDESIKDDAPALLSQGEVNKPQESIINDEPIRPDFPKEDLKKDEPTNLAPPKAVENVKVTAYASCDSIPKGIKNYEKIKRRNGTGTGITKSGERVDGEISLANGKKVKKNIAAADLHYYPIGTVFYVPETGKAFTVKDTGKDIKGKHHIDIYIDKYEDAIRWGNPKLKVWVMVAQK